MRKVLLGAALVLGLSGCESRPEVWERAVYADSALAVGLAGSVAVSDSAMDRLVMMTSPSGRELATSVLSVGKNITSLVPDARGERLFVSSNGALQRVNAGDEPPSLAVVDGGGWRHAIAADRSSPLQYRKPFLVAKYTLESPAKKVDVDPFGEYAVVRVGGGVVSNPNQLLLVKLPPADVTETVDSGNESLVAKTIRSFGSEPQSIQFLPPMNFPDGQRRFLAVQTAREIALIDLAVPEAEITVQLASGSSGSSVAPAEVIYHDNQLPSSAVAAADPRYPLIAIRLAGDSAIQVLSFGKKSAAAPAATSDKATVGTKNVEFLVNINLPDAGGVSSDIDFFWTEVDGAPALRLAALVPQARRAALIDPMTGFTENVDFGVKFDHMVRVTDDVGNEPRTSDVALLWSGTENKIGFWNLASAGATAYRSLESYQVDSPIASVSNITRDQSGIGEDYGGYKLLNGSNGSGKLYVLKLAERQTAPLHILSDASVSVSPDGQRLWAHQKGSQQFAAVSLADLRPATLVVERPVAQVFDIAQADPGARAVIALHAHGTLGATVLDAANPDSADTRFYAGILLGGVQ